MGRRNRNVNKFAQRKRDRKEQAKNPIKKPDEDNRKHYEDIVRENASFEEYYKGQNVCPQVEWNTFMQTLKENLPTAFRITGSKGEADALLNIIKSEYFAEILNKKSKEEITSEPQEEIKPITLPWYPSGLAWQLRLSRTDIRRCEPLYKLHNFLVAETAAGGVSRQEAVSMIPPVVLDVKSHHKVLDMCAAPGSKTAQIIEFLHSDEKIPTGFVVANDVDNNRCYMLVHQAKRLNSPCVLITNHDSSLMPNMYVADDKTPEATKLLKFDRILCDVPCSGDATLRKNPDIWLKWSTGNGNNMHGIQYRCLKRGLELLTVGGRLVYSTCSFNPIENEAVIHRLLQEVDNTVHLIDVVDMLPGLKFNKGMSQWRPASKDMVFYDKYEDVPEKWQTIVRPQMFPPKPEDVEKYHLDRCIRILPHHQDTGGFFVAVLEKTASLPWEKTEEQSTNNSDSKMEDKNAEPLKKRRRMGGYKEDPFVFFSGETEDVYPSIKEYYDLSSDFDPTCLLTRCYVGKKKNIYMVTPSLKDVVQRNANNVKIINTGVKTFVRSDNKNMTCPFRLSQEGLMNILPYIGPKRRISVLKEDLIRILQNDNPNTPPEIKLFSEHTKALVKDLATGSCILEYSDGSGLNLYLVGWRGVQSLKAYTNTADTVHYLRLLGADYSKYDINKFKKVSDMPMDSEQSSVVQDDIDEIPDSSENVPECKDDSNKNHNEDITKDISSNDLNEK